MIVAATPITESGPVTHGHSLFRILQDGKYFAATRDGVAYDYWDELPELRREQYERAATILMERGRDLAQDRMFDPEAATLPPPPIGSRP